MCECSETFTFPTTFISTLPLLPLTSIIQIKQTHTIQKSTLTQAKLHNMDIKIELTCQVFVKQQVSW